MQDRERETDNVKVNVAALSAAEFRGVICKHIPNTYVYVCAEHALL